MPYGHPWMVPLLTAGLTACAPGGWPTLDDPLPRVSATALSGRFPAPPGADPVPAPADPAALWARADEERRRLQTLQRAGLTSRADLLAAQLHLTRLGALVRQLEGTDQTDRLAELARFVANERGRLTEQDRVFSTP